MNKAIIESTYDGLPEFCYSTLQTTGEMIIIKRGEKGYYPIDILSDAYICSVDKNNELIGVTKAQEKAMLMGSMFGWNIPASNPFNYDDNGDYRKTKGSEINE
jgi:hypothetical protein